MKGLTFKQTSRRALHCTKTAELGSAWGGLGAERRKNRAANTLRVTFGRFELAYRIGFWLFERRV